jgi:hypothetical protein
MDTFHPPFGHNILPIQIPRGSSSAGTPTSRVKRDDKGADWFLCPITMKRDKRDAPQVMFLPLTPNVQVVDSELRRCLGLDTAAPLSLRQNGSPIPHAVSALSPVIFNLPRLFLLRFRSMGPNLRSISPDTLPSITLSHSSPTSICCATQAISCSRRRSGGSKLTTIPSIARCDWTFPQLTSRCGQLVRLPPVGASHRYVVAWITDCLNCFFFCKYLFKI